MQSSRICKSICDPDGKCRYVFCASAKIKKWQKRGRVYDNYRAMDPYELLWIVLLIVFVLGELATIGLTCIWFAAGALAALVMAMAGVNPVVQFLVFLVVSILLLAATRPWARKYVNAKMQRTNADSLIGGKYTDFRARQ